MAEGQSIPGKRPTMIEVARLAGVSHQTVSRFLRHEGGLRPETVARIERAVDQLGYRPNLVARSMRTRRTGRLAVLLPHLTFDPARMVAGAAEAAEAAGFTIEVVSVGGTSRRAERAREIADSGQVEGVLSLAPLGADVVEGSVPIIASDEVDDDMRGIGGLIDASPVDEIVAHLVDLGHRRFAYVGGDPGFASARARRERFVAAAARHGVEVTDVVDGDWGGESGVGFAMSWDAGRRPTAVVAANDIVAAGVIRGAWARGWRAPDDLSVTGWDDHAVARFTVPSLTTVVVDREGLGRNAMRRLIAVLRPEAEVGPAPLSTAVIWRESTGPAPVI